MRYPPASTLPAERIHADDDILWLKNLQKFDDRIKKVLASINITVISHDFIMADWDPNVRNCQVVIINYDDITDDMWVSEIEEIAIKHNIKFTYITNIFYCGESSEWFKVLFLKELYGVFYNPNISVKTLLRTNLYTCLMQRTSYPRLKLFAELSRNELLTDGNVSLLGYQSFTDLPPNDIINDINVEFDNIFDDIVQHYQFPFRNFIEPENCFEIEERSKYIIVSETYNDSENKKWISFTEKTFRSLQIPNISLLLNKKGSVNALAEVGIKTHPINSILDYMESYNSQCNFIIGLLKNDMFDEDGIIEIATHNQHKLKEWNTSLKTDELYQNIIKDLL